MAKDYLKRVLFIDEVHPYLQNQLSANGFECIDGTADSYADLCRKIVNVEGVVVRSRFLMNADLLQHGQHLKFIARSGAGIDNIDEEYCRENHIQVFNAPEGNRNAVAEHVVGMLLNLFRHLSNGDEQVRRGIWDREGNRGDEISGKTIGIIGFGNNGSQLGKLLSGFECNILAYDKYKSNFGNHRIQEVSLSEIYEKADIVSFHIPQTEETIHFANESFFNSFKKPIYLVNASRGKAVEIKALVNAFAANQVIGACLDVLEYENLFKTDVFNPDKMPVALQELFKQRVLFTPHVAGWTKESYYKLSETLAKKIISTIVD